MGSENATPAPETTPQPKPRYLGIQGASQTQHVEELLELAGEIQEKLRVPTLTELVHSIGGIGSDLPAHPENWNWGGDSAAPALVVQRAAEWPLLREHLQGGAFPDLLERLRHGMGQLRSTAMALGQRIEEEALAAEIYPKGQALFD